ncbi:hypothetical protein RFI_35206, partial [Reticulomyxa filosa]
IRFWDIRSNKNELYIFKGDDKEDSGIFCLKFIGLKKKKETKNIAHNLNFKLILNLFDLIEHTLKDVIENKTLNEFSNILNLHPVENNFNHNSINSHEDKNAYNGLVMILFFNRHKLILLYEND